MGTGATKTALDKNIDDEGLRTKSKRAAVKMGALRAMAAGPSSPVTPKQDVISVDKQDLLNFIQRQKAEKEEAFSALQAPAASRRRMSSFDKARKDSMAHDKVLSIIAKADAEQDGFFDRFRKQSLINSRCDFCDHTVRFSNSIQCRVCPRNFHKQCLSKSPLYTAEDRVFFQNAALPCGWSCHECSNMCSLLIPEECQAIYDVFDKADVDGDRTISLEEFAKIQKARNSSMTEEDIQRSFKLLDKSHTGYLDMIEFLNKESCMQLSKRPREELVDILSPKELVHARAMFNRIDSDCDGSISKDELKDSVKQWSDVLTSELERRYSTWDTRMGVDYNQGIQALQKNFLWEADADDDGHINWEEYIEHQAMFILWARPNDRISQVK